jgi:hypothetical protein
VNVVAKYFSTELNTNCLVSAFPNPARESDFKSSRPLVIKQRVSASEIESLMRKFVLAYVRCQACWGVHDTTLHTIHTSTSTSPRRRSSVERMEEAARALNQQYVGNPTNASATQPKVGNQDENEKLDKAENRGENPAAVPNAMKCAEAIVVAEQVWSQLGSLETEKMLRRREFHCENCGVRYAVK